MIIYGPALSPDARVSHPTTHVVASNYLNAHTHVWTCADHNINNNPLGGRRSQTDKFLEEDYDSMVLGGATLFLLKRAHLLRCWALSSLETTSPPAAHNVRVSSQSIKLR